MDVPPFIHGSPGSSAALYSAAPYSVEPPREEPGQLAALMASILMLGTGTERTAAPEGSNTSTSGRSGTGGEGIGLAAATVTPNRSRGGIQQQQQQQQQEQEAEWAGRFEHDPVTPSLAADAASLVRALDGRLPAQAHAVRRIHELCGECREVSWLSPICLWPSIVYGTATSACSSELTLRSFP